MWESALRLTCALSIVSWTSSSLIPVGLDADVADAERLAGTSESRLAMTGVGGRDPGGVAVGVPGVGAATAVDVSPNGGTPSCGATADGATNDGSAEKSTVALFSELGPVPLRPSTRIS